MDARLEVVRPEPHRGEPCATRAFREESPTHRDERRAPDCQAQGGLPSQKQVSALHTIGRGKAGRWFGGHHLLYYFYFCFHSSSSSSSSSLSALPLQAPCYRHVSFHTLSRESVTHPTPHGQPSARPRLQPTAAHAWRQLLLKACAWGSDVCLVRWGVGGKQGRDLCFGQ